MGRRETRVFALVSAKECPADHHSVTLGDHFINSHSPIDRPDLSEPFIGSLLTLGCGFNNLRRDGGVLDCVKTKSGRVNLIAYIGIVWSIFKIASNQKFIFLN